MDSAASEPVPFDEEELSVVSSQNSDTAGVDTKATSSEGQKLVQVKRGRTERVKSVRRIPRDGWLAPLEISERGAPGPRASRSGVRASDKGFLPLKVTDYLKLLDWTGRQGRPDKRGQIPPHLSSILERIGIDSGMWCDLVWSFKRYFGRSRAAGRAENMRQDALDHGRSWTQGEKSSAVCFMS